MRGKQGFAAIYILVALGVAVVALVPSWHLPSFLQKKPHTEALTQAQEALVAAKQAQGIAEAQLSAAKAQEAARTLSQAQYAQQMVAGVPLALAKAPQVPEVVLASQLAQRAQIGLAAAIGSLPADKQAEIIQIVDQALSSKQAEVDAAKAALAQKDAQLAIVTKEKAALDQEIPTLQATLTKAQAQVQVKDATVQEKTAEVARWAEKKAAADAKAGSIGTYANNLFRILLIAGLLYLIVHFVLPSLAAEFPGASWLSGLYRSVTSLTSAHTVTTPSLPSKTT